MAKTKKTGQVSASSVKASRLTWREERFLIEYLDNGHNATAAARAAGIPEPRRQAARLLTYVHIQEALEKMQAERRKAFCFDRDKALGILAAMALTTPDEVMPALQRPSDRESYVDLGLKKYAVQVVKSAEGGYESRTISISERERIINNLWEKLGLDSDASETDRVSFLERFAHLGTRLGRSSSGGEPSGEKGP